MPSYSSAWPSAENFAAVAFFADLGHPVAFEFGDVFGVDFVEGGEAVVGGAAAVGDPVVAGVFVEFFGGELGRHRDAVGGGDLFAFFRGFFGRRFFHRRASAPEATVVVWWCPVKWPRKKPATKAMATPMPIALTATAAQNLSPRSFSFTDSPFRSPRTAYVKCFCKPQGEVPALRHDYSCVSETYRVDLPANVYARRIGFVEHGQAGAVARVAADGADPPHRPRRLRPLPRRQRLRLDRRPRRRPSPCSTPTRRRAATSSTPPTSTWPARRATAAASRRRSSANGWRRAATATRS